MEKLAYVIGVQRAYEHLGLKVAAPTAGISSSSSGRTSATPGQQPFWGLGGPTPQGFISRDPASIQAGAQPGGPAQLDAAPKATPATRPGPSPSTAMPAANPPVAIPSATGLSAPMAASETPPAGNAASLGIPSANPFGGGTKK